VQCCLVRVLSFALAYPSNAQRADSSTDGNCAWEIEIGDAGPSKGWVFGCGHGKNNNPGEFLAFRYQKVRISEGAIIMRGRALSLLLFLAYLMGIASGVPVALEPALTANATKVQVSLYYETLCPSCRKFVSGPLFSATSKLGEIMHLSLFPWGNAK
jgi:hypothetical protein